MTAIRLDCQDTFSVSANSACTTLSVFADNIVYYGKLNLPLWLSSGSFVFICQEPVRNFFIGLPRNYTIRGAPTQWTSAVRLRFSFDGPTLAWTVTPTSDIFAEETVLPPPQVFFTLGLNFADPRNSFILPFI